MNRVQFKKLINGQGKKITLSTILIFLGLIIFIIGLTKLWDWYTTTHRLQLPPSTVTITHSDNSPNEAKIDISKESYSVPANQPRLLEIPSIDVKGYVQQVGIDQFGAIATPSNINLAGWFNGSVKPGEKGVSIIDGHVYGKYESAIFHELKNLKTNDTITIEYGDTKRINFSVIKVSRYNKTEANKHMFEKQPSVDHQLVLITCGGRFDKTTQTYDERILVYSKKI